MTEITEKPRCRVGSKSDNPCPREATERFRAEGPEPNLCGPHARAWKLGEAEDGWHYALDKLSEWARATSEDDPFGQLEQMVVNARDEAREQYAAAHARVRAADLAADAHDGRTTPEQGERMAVLMARCDGFADARTMLEDTPEDTFGPVDKWLIVDTLAKAANSAHEEYERYQREIGPPLASAVAGSENEVHASV